MEWPSCDEPAYHALCAYTLGLGDSRFIHQHVVDAYMAQHADAQTKPIGITFSLLGLYLAVERGVSGKDVQRVHMQLGKQKHEWPAFELPMKRGAMTAADVMAAPEGPERDAAILAWAASVWAACSGNRDTVIALLSRHGVLPD